MGIISHHPENHNKADRDFQIKSLPQLVEKVFSTSWEAVEKASGCCVFAPKVYKGTSSGQKHSKYMQNRLIFDVSDDFFLAFI